MASNSSNELSWQEQLELAAHRLGVPASRPLSVERYLAEACSTGGP
jgi:hypothetical protein